MHEDTKLTLVLSCIQNGEPVRADTIMQRTGLSRSEVGTRLWRLRNYGQLMLIDRGVYTKTANAPPLPHEVLAMKSAEKARREKLRKAARARFIEKQRESRRLAAERAREIAAAKRLELERRQMEEAARSPRTTVAKAIANRHPLASVWGAVNA